MCDTLCWSNLLRTVIPMIVRVYDFYPCSWLPNSHRKFLLIHLHSSECLDAGAFLSYVSFLTICAMQMSGNGAPFLKTKSSVWAQINEYIYIYTTTYCLSIFIPLDFCCWTMVCVLFSMPVWLLKPMHSASSKQHHLIHLTKHFVFFVCWLIARWLKQMMQMYISSWEWESRNTKWYNCTVLI